MKNNKYPELQCFVERYLMLRNFETFQLMFSKLGIMCYIAPDSYKNTIINGEIFEGGLTWVGHYEWLENGKWLFDDTGTCSTPHEAKEVLIESVLILCKDQNINFLK